MLNKFESHISGEVPVVVDFFADWCDSCKTMQPILIEVKDIVGPCATILKMNVDKNRFYSEKYEIQTIPTLIIFKNGKVIWRKSGVTNAKEIVHNLAKSV